MDDGCFNKSVTILLRMASANKAISGVACGPVLVTGIRNVVNPEAPSIAWVRNRWIGFKANIGKVVLRELGPSKQTDT